MLTNFATSESTASGIGAFGVNWQSFVFQLITFLLVIWVLNKFVLKKLFSVIDERKKEIDAGLERSEFAKKELEKASIKADKVLADARTQADEILSSAHGEAAELLHSIEQKAAIKAERIVTEARAQLKVDTDKAREQLKKETAIIVAKATEIVIKEKLDSDKDIKLINDSLKDAK